MARLPIFGPRNFIAAEWQPAEIGENAVYRRIAGGQLMSASVYGTKYSYTDSQGKWRAINLSVTSSREPGFGFESRNFYNAFFGGSSKDAFTKFEFEGRSIEFRPLNPLVTRAQPKGNRVLYWQVYNNTDIWYSVAPNALKEEIVLKNKHAATTYRFVLTPKGVYPTVETNGEVWFRDVKTKARLFIFEKPFMTDGNGLRSNNVSLKISPLGQRYIVEVVADKQWLADPHRKYPVTIDPTTTLQPASEGKDVYICRDGNGGSWCWGSGLDTAPYAYVGNATVSGTYSYNVTTLIQFDLAGWRNNTIIHDAELYLYGVREGGTGGNWGDMPIFGNITVKQNNQSWVENIGTGTAPTYNYTFYNWTHVGGPANGYGNLNTPTWFQWNITNMVKYWVNGTTPNYGVTLVENDTRILYLIQFLTSDYTSDATKRPALNITYTNVSSIAPYWFLNSTNTTAPGAWTSFRTFWTDDEELGSLVFAFDNGTGTFVNSSPISIGEILNETANLSGLVALYHVNSDNIDYSGNANHLNATKMAVNDSGRFGGGYRFNATAKNYLAAPNSSSLTTPLSNLTVMAWVYLNESSATQESNARIVAKEYSSLSPYVSYALEANSGGGGLFAFEMNTGGSSLTTLTSTTTPTAGQWYHLAATYNGTHMLLYVNGTKEAQAAKTGVIGYTAWPLDIGGDAYRNIEWLNGTVDEIVIFNRTLSASEIQSIYNYTAKWINVTQLVNRTNSTIRWYAWANDTYGYGNTTSVFQYAAIVPGPRYENRTTHNVSVFNSTWFGGYNATTTFASNFSVYVDWWSANNTFKGNGSGTYYSPPIVMNTNRSVELLNASWDWYEASSAGNMTAGLAGSTDKYSGTILSLHLEGDGKDSGKFNYTGVPTGNTTAAMTQNNCVVGKCLLFDGSNDGLVISSAPRLASRNFTIALWIKPLAGLGVNDNFIGAYNGAGWLFRSNAADATILDFSNGATDYNSASGTITTGAWQHVAVTYNGSAYVLYKNATRVLTSAASQAGATDSGTIDIGRIPSAGFEFPGYIDEVHIFNRSLTDAEISTLFGYESAGVFPKNFTSVALAARTKDYSFNSSGLVGWWDLGDEAGSDLPPNNQSFDLSGNNNTLVLGNSTSGSVPPINTTASVIGRSRSFNGVNQLATLGKTLLNGLANFSVSFWVNKKGDPAVLYRMMTQCGNAGTACSGTNLFTINLLANGTVGTELSPGGVYCQVATVPYQLPNNSWQLITVTRNASWANVYVNGTLLGSATGCNTGTLSSSLNFLLTDFESNSKFLNGSLDDVKIWNRSISQAEVAALYNNGCPTCSGGQEANWSNWTLPATNYTNWNASIGAAGRILQFNATLTSPIAGENYSAFLYRINYSAGDRTYAPRVNQTVVNRLTSFTVNWTDSTPLDTYIMAIDNGNGSFYNLSPTVFAGNPLAALAATNYTINNTNGSRVKWYVWANNTAGSGNTTEVYSFTANGQVPTWSANSTNSTGATGRAVNFLVNWTDSSVLSSYILSIDNGSGTFVNQSPTAFSGTANWTNATLLVNVSTATIRWYVWANNTQDVSNTTDVFSFNVINPPPTSVNTTNGSVVNVTSFTGRGANNGTRTSDPHVDWWASNATFKQNGTGTYYSPALAMNSTQTQTLVNVTWDWYEASNAGNLTAGAAGDSLPWQGTVLSLHLENDTDDSTRFNNSGVLYGNTTGAMRRPACAVGGCLTFDGVNDAVNLTAPATLNFSKSNFTISAWAYDDNASSNLGGVVSRYSAATANGSGWFINTLNDEIAFRIANSSAIAQASYAWTRKAWHHIVGVRNGTSVALYVDGALRDVDTIDQVIPVAEPSAGIMVGAGISTSVPGYYWNGSIDEVHVFNRSLSQAEVTALYGFEAAGRFAHNFTNLTLQVRAKDYVFNASGLVAWWDLGDSNDNETLTNASLDLAQSNATLSFGNSSAASRPTMNSTGIVGNALAFDGTSQYLEAPALPSRVNLTTNFTVAMWFWQKPQLQGTLLSEDTLGLDPFNAFNIFSAGNGVITAESNNVDGVTSLPTVTKANSWVHAVVTHDKALAGNNTAIYINGTLAQSGNLTSLKDYSHLTIGRRGVTTPNSYFNGSIDDIKIWDRVLSAPEIAALYNNGCPACGGGPESNWTAWSVNSTTGLLLASALGRVAQFKALFESPIAGENYSAFLTNFTYSYGFTVYPSVNQTGAGEPTTFYANWTDSDGLSMYIMAIDNGNGSFYNLTPAAFAGNPAVSLSTNNYTINSTIGTPIRWYVWANDSINTGATTAVQSFTTTTPIRSENTTACRILNVSGTTYNMTQDVDASGTCYVVTANNVSLDCKGKKVTFGSGYGFQNDGFNYTTLFNCTFIQKWPSAAQAAGVFYSNMTFFGNVSYVNSTTVNQSLWFNASAFASVTWSNLSSNESDTLQFDATNSSIIAYNNVTSNYTNRTAVMVNSPASNNSVDWNNVTVFGNTTFSYGITLSGPLGGHNASHNRVYANGTAFRLAGGVNASLYDNDAQFTCAGVAAQQGGSNNSQFWNGSFTYFVSDACDGSELDNYATQGSNVTYVNVTLNNAYFGTGVSDNISVWWYADANVTNTNDAPLGGYTVAIRNATAGALGAAMISAATYSNGTINFRLVLEFQGNAQDFANYTPHNFTATSGSFVNSTNFSVDHSGYYLMRIGATGNQPVMSTVTITPATANATKQLNCTATVTDSDSPTGLTVEFTWWKNGLPNATYDASITGVTSGATVSTSLNVTPLTKGDTWKCSSRGYDGAIYGAYENSTGLTVANAPPIVLTPSWSIDPIDLSPGYARGIGPTNASCWAVVQDFDGYADITEGRGAAYNVTTTTPEGADDNNVRYTNNSCIFLSEAGTSLTVNCTFSLKYYAAQGYWTCRINATDTGPATDQNYANATVNPTVAIGALPATIAYGSLLPGQTSTAQTVVVTNWGNVQVDAKQEATNLTYFSNEQPGCCYYNITPNSLGYSPNADMSGATPLPETGLGTFDTAYNLAKTTAETEQNRSHYYNLTVPLGIPGGSYSGTLTIYAQSG